MVKKSKCSQCKKEFSEKELIVFWDNVGDGHYCDGNWQRNHFRGRWSWLLSRPLRYNNCCQDFSNFPLFLCQPCYQSYQERKSQTIQQHKETARITIIATIPILFCGFIFVFFCLVKGRARKNNKSN